MEVLSSEVVDYRMPIIVFVILLLVSIVVGYTIALTVENNIIGAISTIILAMAVVTVCKDSQNNIYKQQKVIVSDWNKVYEEGWKVIGQDDKIVTLQKVIDKEND